MKQYIGSPLYMLQSDFETPKDIFLTLLSKSAIVGNILFSFISSLSIRLWISPQGRFKSYFVTLIIGTLVGWLTFVLIIELSLQPEIARITASRNWIELVVGNTQLFLTQSMTYAFLGSAVGHWVSRKK